MQYSTTMETYFVLMSTVILSTTRVSGQFQWTGSEWPVDGCHTRNVDLVLIPDATSPDQYAQQMRFFSRLVDVFSPLAETDLGRLRVALVAFKSDGSGNTQVDIRISLDAHQKKINLKRSIENNSFVLGNVTFDSVMTILQNWFKKTSTLTRQDAVKLVIMAAASIKVPDRILTTQDPSSATTISLSFPLFLVIFQRDLYVLFGQFSQKNSLAFVPDIKGFDAIKNNLSISLCGQCFDGWVSKVDNSSVHKPAGVACYKLEKLETQQNWIDVRARCENEHFSNLASFETKQELRFVRNFLLGNKTFLAALANKTKSPVGVFIGLRRGDWTRGRRFKWVNNMPLVHTYWGSDQPMNGISASCALWTFITRLNATQNTCPGRNESGSILYESNNTDHQVCDNFVDYWSSVGCGSYTGTFFICESDYRVEDENSVGEIWTLEMPTDYTIFKALQKGELAQTSKLTFISASSVRMFTGSRIIANPNITELTSFESVPKFECEKDGANAIFYNFVCDFRFDCQNKRDEKICNYRECKPEFEFTCRSGQCISKDLVCDLFEDCRDGDDELWCFPCPHARCQDGRCLPKHWFSDGEIDCDTCSSVAEPDTNEKSQLDKYISLEMKSAQITEPSGCVFTCNGTKCVALSMLNNGIVDCLGSEGPIDETIGALESTTCYNVESAQIQYSNWAPKCVYVKDRYGEPLGCRNMKHLENCEDFICPDGYVKCPESYCIPSHYVQNSVFDCADGEDESSSLILECPGHFICSSDNRKHQCLHLDLVCDGFRHCPNGDDEKSCDVTCAEGFLCVGGTVVPSPDRPDVLTDLVFIDIRTRYLDLSGIDLSKVFPIAIIGHFANIITAKLANCNVTNVNEWSVMNEFRSLQSLDLSYNRIADTTTSCIFRFMPSLKFLNLSTNARLLSLNSNSFRLLQKPRSPLEVLDLSFTGLTEMRWGVFKTLTSLTYLSLRGTRIAIIKPDMFPENFALAQLDMRGLSAAGITPGLFRNITITSKMYFDNFKLCCPQLHNENTSIKGCQFIKDPFSSCSDLMSSGILRTVLWVNGFLAVSGNGAVIWYRLVFDKRIFRMGYGHFVTQLGISDMLMGIYLITIAAVDSFYRDSYLWNEAAWRSSFVCKFSGFISTLSVEVSTFFIFLITLDRFLVIRFPFGQFRIKGHFVAVVCAAVWVTGVTIALMPGLPYFGDWSVYTTSGMCLGLPLISDENPGWQFVQGIFIYLNFVLFLLIALGQVAIYRTMSAMSMNQSCLTNSSVRRSQDMTVAKRLSLVAVSNFLCWFPVGVTGIVVLAGQQIGTDAYAWLAAVVLPVNSAINPLVYTIPGLILRFRRPIESPTQQLSLKSQNCK